MQRKCVGCGEYFPREELIRITKTANGNIVVDGNSKIFGRSAYICYNKDCVEGALKKGRLQKVLRTSLDEDVIEKIRVLSSIRSKD